MSQNAAQVELIESDPRRPTTGKLDPLWKPSWAVWKQWDVFRRILNDRRIDDASFRAWHHLHNSKDANSVVTGDRVDAAFIGKKFGWKPATVYRNLKRLQAFGYLQLQKLQGNKHSAKVVCSAQEPQSDQTEFPFLLDSSSAPRGIASSAPRDSSSAPRGIAAYNSNCDVIVSTDCDVPRASRAQGTDVGLPGDPAARADEGEGEERKPEFTLERAIAEAGADYPKGFIKKTYHKAMARGGLQPADAKGIPIRSWSNYLASEYRFEVKAGREKPLNARQPNAAQPIAKARSECPDAPGPMPGTPEFDVWERNGYQLPGEACA